MMPILHPLTARLTARASVAFMLELVQIGRLGRSFNDGMIALAVIQANVEPVNRDPVLQRAYATLETPPPDDLRRPVSVSAIANALRLPYETVRRRIAYLAAEGVCEITPKGIVAPTAALVTLAHRAVLDHNSACVEAFYGQLRDIGFLGPPKPGMERFPPGQEPLRAVARVSADYALRMLEYLTARVGDLVRCVIFLEILRGNTEGLTDVDRGLGPAGEILYMPDEMRRPVSVSAVAARLRIPAETVRRHAAQLTEEGRCARAARGLIVPASQFSTPEIAEVLRENYAFIGRMFNSLAPLGVLLDWEERRLGDRPAMAVGL